MNKPTNDHSINTNIPQNAHIETNGVIRDTKANKRHGKNELVSAYL